MFSNNLYVPFAGHQTRVALPINMTNTTALMKLKDDIFDNMDNGKVTDMVLIDLLKVFDTINHSFMFQ